jgi:hypothetical protein
MCHLRLGNTEKARDCCTKAIAVDPDNVKVIRIAHCPQNGEPGSGRRRTCGERNKLDARSCPEKGQASGRGTEGK